MRKTELPSIIRMRLILSTDHTKLERGGGYIAYGGDGSREIQTVKISFIGLFALFP